MKQKENVKEREQYMNLKSVLFILFLGLCLLSCGNKTKSEENALRNEHKLNLRSRYYLEGYQE